MRAIVLSLRYRESNMDQLRLVSMILEKLGVCRCCISYIFFFFIVIDANNWNSGDYSFIPVNM